MKLSRSRKIVSSLVNWEKQDVVDDIFQLKPTYPLKHPKGCHELRYEHDRLDVNQGAWKLETERGVIMDGDKPEHLLEAVPVMGCYCDVIGVRSFARFENKEDDYNEKILSQFIEHSGRRYLAWKRRHAIRCKVSPT